MALTEKVKTEIAQVNVTSSQAKVSELAALIRFAGSLHLVSGALIIEIEVDQESTARRAQEFVAELFDSTGSIQVLGSTSSRKQPTYLVRWADRGLTIARQTGIIDRAGRPVRGLPRKLVSGTLADCEAAWRGAFLARGHLTEPGRSSSLEVVAPGPEAALALAGHARRLGITAKSREVRGSDRVQVRDADAIGALLTRMGAQQTRLEWEEQRMKREVRATANRLANFDDANLRRSARAAVTAAARVERAMEILGDEVPEHLADAGRLRIEHRRASLEELGELSDPPISKDAVAGRIRRLLSLADKRAAELGVPDTYSAVTDDLFDDSDE